MPRSTWEGFLRLSLISIPVRAYNSALPEHGVVRFHQIHKGCGERIQYKKFCPVHGEVTKEDIVSGYAVNKGEYVEIGRDEIKQLEAQDDEAINIEAFTPPETVAPVYFSGKTFYLVPDGPAGQKPYALLRQVMEDKGVQAVAHMVLSGHEQYVLIRPVGKVLEMVVLYYHTQVRPVDAYDDEISQPKVSAQEMKLATALVEQSTVRSFDLTKLVDHYTERVTELIESKAAGRKPAPPKRERHRAVINLMDALKKSLKQGQEKKPHRKKTG
jgi:DNA end-binding protein Ku